MKGQELKFKTSKRNFIIALFLLLLTNVLMGFALIQLSKNTIREQMEEHMLDIANAAANLLDGDAVYGLTDDDKGTNAYDTSMNILRTFQEKIELDYIYLVRAEGNDVFTFVLDPDSEAPAAYGQRLKTTDGLKNAANGKPSADKEAHSDKWGEFYSAYSPVYDSAGNVSGIIGVDFNAEWYNGKLRINWAVVAIVTMVALSIGIVLAFIIMSQNRQRFVSLISDLEHLEHRTQDINRIMMRAAAKKLDDLPTQEGALLRTLAAGEENALPQENRDEFEELADKIRNIQNRLEKYIRFIDDDLYRDNLTGVLNKIAYKKRINQLNEAIGNGTAAFSIAFFDVNELKTINTYYGFEVGDELMRASADILKEIFGQENVYRVAGDEFIALMDGKTQDDMQAYFVQLERALKKYNAARDEKPMLAIAKGMNTFDPNQHESYRPVFVDAESNMELDKAEYYEKLDRKPAL